MKNKIIEEYSMDEISEMNPEQAALIIKLHEKETKRRIDWILYFYKKFDISPKNLIETYKTKLIPYGDREEPLDIITPDIEEEKKSKLI